MGVLLAPYTSGMRLGSGFNSYTQQLCVDGAVTGDSPRIEKKVPATTSTSEKQVAQSVTFTRSRIRKTSDITQTLNISGAMTVKYNNLFDGNGQADFINSNTINTSDITYMFNVKVVNQVIEDHTLNKFNPLPKIKPDQFTDVYGDCFISGFQEGGEFNALISIKVSNRSQTEDITAKAAIAFSTPKFAKKEEEKKEKDQKPTPGPSSKPAAAASGEEESGLQVKGDGEATRAREEIFADNEVKYSVSWTGGGQYLKGATEDWNFETILAAATRFPDLVAKTPMRTHAVLTKYSALKSFHSMEQIYSPLSYDNVTIYTNILMDAYLEYKNILREIQELTSDVQSSKLNLEASPMKNAHQKFVESLQIIGYKISWPKDGKKLEPKPYVFTTKTDGDNSGSPPPQSGAGAGAGSGSSSSSSTDLVKAQQQPAQRVADMDPLVIPAPYPPSLAGLVAARIHCRFLMNRIVKEVDLVTKNPEYAHDEERLPPYMSASLFRELLPRGTTEPPAGGNA